MNVRFVSDEAFRSGNYSVLSHFQKNVGQVAAMKGIIAQSKESQVRFLEDAGMDIFNLVSMKQQSLEVHEHRKDFEFLVNVEFVIRQVQRLHELKEIKIRNRVKKTISTVKKTLIVIEINTSGKIPNLI